MKPSTYWEICDNFALCEVYVYLLKREENRVGSLERIWLIFHMDEEASNSHPKEFVMIELCNKKSLVRVNFFVANSFVVTWKNFPSGWFNWKDSFFPLKLRSKSRILIIFGVFGLLCTTLYSLSRASASVPLASLESSDPFYAVGSTWKSLWDPGRTIQVHLL